MDVHIVSSIDSPEFTHLTRALSRSTLIGLDAEWKPIRSQQSTFPMVTLLQLACQLGDDPAQWDESLVFLLDLASIPLSSIWELLKDVFVSPDILKLGFKFKQDLIFLSSTFRAQGCDPGFDKVEPYLDITNVYKFLQHKQGKKVSKDTKSLSAICKEVLGFSLCKELQCSDWSHRPLTEEQIRYAATDAHCLLGIFKVFQAKVVKEGHSCNKVKELRQFNVSLGLKDILEMPDGDNKLIGTKFCNALDIVQATASSEDCERIAKGVEVIRKTKPMDESLWKIVRKYGEKLLLRESDRIPKTSKKKGKKGSLMVDCREKQLENSGDWQGPPPWDISLGGDGCPKFLCDVMVEGLAKHLRCVGVDAAIPHSKKPEPRELIDQAYKEKRVLLTRDAKLLRHQYLIRNQIYRVKNLLKNEQLLEVIEIFQLKISEDQLMSRCTKCNGRFIQKPLTTEEAIEAAKGFQRIPNCLFDKNLEFWQCMDCNQLYWELVLVRA
ncbi:exonuclease mut-7 homolog isoform X2 [Durio zibethinus]|uniref:Exonuclease mut-7 homolog isoform X2 n=1 Tax=Durio zibethinus TaxID=66656 RepID=A0A6P5X6E1_DURZI|nr:exonuclease mut-7 homolog isoform X2 [Durio zibethinus]XP_022723222.1 exonuclease mut-7 homolog isoform X2 [Durio zibethinus]